MQTNSIRGKDETVSFLIPSRENVGKSFYFLFLYIFLRNVSPQELRFLPENYKILKCSHPMRDGNGLNLNGLRPKPLRVGVSLKTISQVLDEIGEFVRDF